ncbi:glycoside hydrolase family 5 protein [Actinoallomurus spadix]|uniref:glycoside hydrolase family 5 protein n=1 Tax=Actinoallomurus spadix TaxID=79912 RepID=UPI0020926BFA|nr:cellulase family glycosylhydrolase [Actinoallomurus spadix]MCO5987958.1 glycoside hydrolase family 5 protein [Actinoallomurus spadix]
MRRSAGLTLATLLLTAGTCGTALAGTPAREPGTAPRTATGTARAATGTARAATGTARAATGRARAATGRARAAALTRLHATSSHAFVDSAGTTHLLTGPNIQPVWDAHDTGTWGQSTYDSIKAKGFTAVRMVLFWDMFQPTEAEWNETAFATLATAVTRAKAAGLYVILDCVHMSGGNDGQEHVPGWAQVTPDDTTEGLDAVVENGLGFLQTIANRYQDEPAIAAYDPVNEPFRSSTRSARLLSDYTKIVNAIRAKDGVTNIMLEPSYGDSKVPASSFSSFTPTNRGNLIWSVHDYYNGAAKSGYTNGYDNSTGLGMVPNPSDGTTGYNSANKAGLASHLQVQLDLAKTEGLPVWIGEFGIGAGATGHDQYVKDKVALYKSKGLDYAWWEYSSGNGSGPFSMVDANENWRSWVSYLF